MKTEKYDIGFLKEPQENALQKLPYEKPRLGTVVLFADQVLSNCKIPSPGNITCAQLAS